MTNEMLRHYFAGVAMQSLIQQRGSVDAQSYGFIARESYKLADAMLEAGMTQPMRFTYMGTMPNEESEE